MKKTTTYRQSKQESLFEKEFTLKALSAVGNPLEQVSALVDFEFFRSTLEKTLLTEDCKTSAGRRPIDVVLIFKVIFLQRYYGLGDHQIEYQIIDRTSFREFLNIHTVGDVPDEKTVLACKNKLVKASVFDTLFDDFRQLLDAKGLSFSEARLLTPPSFKPPGSATLAGKTLPSRAARKMSFGTTTHTRNATRTLTHVGLRNGMRNIMDTLIVDALYCHSMIIFVFFD